MPSWTMRRDRRANPTMIPWAAGRFYSHSWTGGTTTVSSLQVNFRAFPIYVPNPEGVTVTSVGIEVTGASGIAGSVIRMGIYADDDGMPGELLHDVGTVDSNPGAVPTLGSIVTSIYLAQGWYWLAACADTSCTVRATSASTSWPSVGLSDVGDATVKTHVSMAPDFVAWATDGLPRHWPETFNSGSGASGAPRVMLGV